MNHVSYVLSPVKRVSCVGFPEIYVGGGNKHSVFFPLGRRAPKLGPNVHVMGHRTWENKHKPMATPTNLIRCLEEMCTHGCRCRWICTLLLSQWSKELPSTRAGVRVDVSTEKLFTADRESSRQTGSTLCGQPAPTASCDARNYCSWPALS